ncbi:MAG: hypothetical protein HN683_04790 [Gammaproteobacteria bacterium]|jgi:hypothetical protein|nr:hypothetical protein [Gammaproteobacteria bacterium]
MTELVTISEAQAKRLESIGVPVQLTYAVDKKIIDAIEAVAGHATPKRAKKKQGRHSMEFKRTGKKPRFNKGSARDRAIKVLNVIMPTGDVLTRDDIQVEFIKRGVCDRAYAAGVISELVQAGDLKVTRYKGD